jgi:putative membrane protein
MKKILLSLLVLPAAIMISCNSGSSGNAGADSTKSADMQNDKKFDSTNVDNDAEFAVFAADGGMAEVLLGKLAMTNASAQNVKDLGKMLADDHQKAGDELKALAQQYNITLPGAVSNDHQKKYDDLTAKKGADFDKDYLDAMEDGHTKTISKFETEADKGNNAALKQWASEKLPTLRHHLETIRQIKSSMK